MHDYHEYIFQHVRTVLCTFLFFFLHSAYRNSGRTSSAVYCNFANASATVG